MRIKIQLHNPDKVAVPLSQNYLLASAIYDYLEQSDPDYATFLHEEGYALGARSYKLFTFAPLQAKERKINGANIRFLSPVITWQVSSPMDDFLRGFAAALLEQGRTRIGKTTLTVKDVEVPIPPRFTEQMSFTCLSPITVSAPEERNGKFRAHYCRPDEPDFSERVRQNLLNKYEVLHGQQPEDDSFQMEFDAGYLRKHKRVTKLIKFKDTDIIGVLAPFRASGNAALIQVGYGCGFGDKNSAGFGMVEVDSKARR